MSSQGNILKYYDPSIDPFDIIPEIGKYIDLSKALKMWKLNDKDNP